MGPGSITYDADPVILDEVLKLVTLVRGSSLCFTLRIQQHRQQAYIKSIIDYKSAKFVASLVHGINLG